MKGKDFESAQFVEEPLALDAGPGDTEEVADMIQGLLNAGKSPREILWELARQSSENHSR